MGIANDARWVILTSSSSAEDEKECYKRGCDKFCCKPMSLNDYQRIAGDVMRQFIKEHSDHPLTVRRSS